MPDEKIKPVVLLIYASTGQHLEQLQGEIDAIADHLEASNLCEVRIVPAATLAEVITTINQPNLRNRVVAVHYAGHANGQGIQLASENGEPQGELAHMRGLASVLEAQHHLRLFFINGCASREQVLELTQVGIPLIIATNRGIDDKVARDFAERFYITLSQQQSIAGAFNAAEGELQTRDGNTRALYVVDFEESEAAQQNESPWEIHGPNADRLWTLKDPYYRGTGPRWDYTKYELNQESPYLGLRYFGESQSHRFFGRDEFVRELLTESETAPLLLVIGASGTGKSSVVRAGLIPAWKKNSGAAGQPRVFVLTPEDDPFDQLSMSLGTADTFDRNLIRQVRTPSSTALRDAYSTFGKGESWLIFIDQFEQIFTRTSDKKNRTKFLNSIADLANLNDPNICLVLAMRDDFFPQLRDYPDLFPITDKNFHRVAALDRKALREVVERPAAEHGVTFEPGLVDDIIEAIEGQPGALPLLQYTLDALWEKDDVTDLVLNTSTYDSLGRVKGSLGQRFKELYEDQYKEGKDEFRWMMLKLVTHDEGAAGQGFVSRLTPKSEFIGRQAALLSELIAQGLVVSSGTTTPSVQLGHEKIIDAWPEYAKWMDQHNDANSMRQQISEASSHWMKLKDQERTRDDRKKTARSLWQGHKLGKALDLCDRGEFAQVGGLGPDHKRFLNTSRKYSLRMRRLFNWAFGLAICFFVVAAIFAIRENNAKTSLQQANENLISQSAKALIGPIGVSQAFGALEAQNLVEISNASADLREQVLDRALRSDVEGRLRRVEPITVATIGIDTEARKTAVGRFFIQNRDETLNHGMILRLAAHLELGWSDGEQDAHRRMMTQLVDEIYKCIKSNCHKVKNEETQEFRELKKSLLRLALLSEDSSQQCQKMIVAKARDGSEGLSKSGRTEWIRLLRDFLYTQPIESVIAGWTNPPDDLSKSYTPALNRFSRDRLAAPKDPNAWNLLVRKAIGHKKAVGEEAPRIVLAMLARQLESDDLNIENNKATRSLCHEYVERAIGSIDSLDQKAKARTSLKALNDLAFICQGMSETSLTNMGLTDEQFDRIHQNAKSHGGGNGVLTAVAKISNVGVVGEFADTCITTLSSHDKRRDAVDALIQVLENLESENKSKLSGEIASDCVSGARSAFMEVIENLESADLEKDVRPRVRLLRMILHLRQDKSLARELLDLDGFDVANIERAREASYILSCIKTTQQCIGEFDVRWLDQESMPLQITESYKDFEEFYDNIRGLHEAFITEDANRIASKFARISESVLKKDEMSDLEKRCLAAACATASEFLGGARDAETHRRSMDRLVELMRDVDDRETFRIFAKTISETGTPSDALEILRHPFCISELRDQIVRKLKLDLDYKGPRWGLVQFRK